MVGRENDLFFFPPNDFHFVAIDSRFREDCNYAAFLNCRSEEDETGQEMTQAEVFPERM